MIKRFLKWRQYKKTKRVTEILFLQKMNEILDKEIKNKELENEILEQNKKINESFDGEEMRNIISYTSKLCGGLKDSSTKEDFLLSLSKLTEKVIQDSEHD